MLWRRLYSASEMKQLTMSFLWVSQLFLSRHGFKHQIIFDLTESEIQHKITANQNIFHNLIYSCTLLCIYVYKIGKMFFIFTYFWTKYLMLNRLKTVKAIILWHFIIITVFFFNILKNVLYAFDGKAEFFSSTWSFRKHLIIQTICAVYVNNPGFVLTLIFRCLEAASSLHRSWEADPVQSWGPIRL